MPRTPSTPRITRALPPRRTPVPTTPAVPELALLREPAVLSVIPWCRATMWDRIRNGTFPAPVRLGPHQVAWRLTDIRAFVEALPESRSEDQPLVERGDSSAPAPRRGRSDAA